MDSLNRKHTWVPEKNTQVNPSRTYFILQIKRESNRVWQRFKTRVLGGGIFLTFGYGYHGRYAPVAPFSLVPGFLYLVVSRNLCITQPDVKTAFMNGELTEGVCVM